MNIKPNLLLLLALTLAIGSCRPGEQANRQEHPTRTAEEYVESGIERRENFRAAIEDFTRAIEMDPEFARAYDHRGRAKAAHLVRDYHGAIEDFTTAIDLDPEYTLTYLHRGFAKIHLDNHIGAIEDYTKAIEFDPEYAVAYYQRGMTRLQLGETGSGCEDLNKAWELGFGEAYMKFREHCH